MRYRPASKNSLARAALAAAALCAAACLQSNDPADYFRVEAGPDLLGYSRIAIHLDDTAGRRVEVLYDDSLRDLRRLERLPSRRYTGETARILIEGYKGARLAYRESRLYEGRTQKLLDLEIERFGDTGAPGGAPSVPDPAAGGGGHPAQAPRLSAFPRDTVVSIRDSVPLPALATDSDGDLASYAWECGPGGPRDSGAIGGIQAKIGFGVRFADPGERVCRLTVSDTGKRTASGTVKVKVELDPPWADAGKDTTVPLGGIVILHARGEDGLGPIVSRAWSLEGGPFRPVPQTETTSPAPSDAGDYRYILKVTDSDSLSALDTLVVHVPPSPGAALTGTPGSSGVTP